MDSSAITKRYSNELGSDWVRRQTHGRSGNSIIISSATRVELTSALSRKTREGHMRVADRDRALRAFASHCTRRRYRLVAVSDEVIRLAVRLLVRHPLRAYDALQLASALLVNRLLTSSGAPPLTFVCSDQKLLDIAKHEGLLVDDPEAHP